MKRIFLPLLLGALLTGCHTQAPDTPAEDTQTVTLYLADETASYLIPTPTEVQSADDMVPVLIDALIANGALPNEDIAANHTVMDEQNMTLDMNQAFADTLAGTGTTGEFLYMNALVNTFLDYYDLDSLTVTAEGQIIETGHTIYEEPFTALNGLEIPR